MRKERVNEMWGVVFLLLGLFAFTALLFFDPHDLSFYHFPPHPRPFNPTGILGAVLAHSLLISFGLAAYLIPLLFLLWSWCFFTQRLPERKLFKGIGLAVGLAAASVFLGIVSPSDQRFLRGGAVGYVLGSELLKYFGQVGALILTVSCFLLALLLATDFLIYPLLKSLGDACVGVLQRFQRGLGGLRDRMQERVRAWREQFARHSKRGITTSVQPLATLSEVPEGPMLRTTFPMEKPSEEKASPESRKSLRKQTKPEPAIPPEPLALQAAAGEYKLPPLDLLRRPEHVPVQADDLRLNSRIVEETLNDFGIEAKVVAVEQGPVITRYELLPAPGIKVNRILSLGDDLALALKATSLRFIAPIPGKSAIGIEMPNTKSSVVYLRELLESREFRSGSWALPMAIGKDTSGQPLMANLAEMPHLLIAGTTGSGKTVCVNSIIAGLLFHAPPERLKMVMIDPKMVELAVFGRIPHMLAPVVTELKKAAATLNWVVQEMENRYRLFASRGVRNIQTFNVQSEETLPYIVVVIDELADLMMVAQDKVEGAITRLAQLSRAVGIHMVLATQRPSVDVITGVIKANFPARISFKVASKVDSRTVLDLNGADKLLGKGDLLFLKPGESKLIRGQGSFVVDEEISRVVDFVAAQQTPEYHPEIQALSEAKTSRPEQDKDELFEEAVRVVLETGVASASTLQRRLRLGYTRAARIIDQMEVEGIVGPHRGSKPREILVDRAEVFDKGSSLKF